MTIIELQQTVDRWIKQHGVRYFDQLTNTALLMEEVGELARIMARVYGEQSFKDKVEKQQIHDRMADEMADILFVLTCLANQCGIDLSESIDKNLVKKSNRDKNRHFQNPKLS